MIENSRGDRNRRLSRICGGMETSYNYYKMFGCFNRKFKVSEAEPPLDVKEAFRRYAEGESHMTTDQLLKFLVEYQREHWRTLGDAEAIMQQVFKQRHQADHCNRGFTIEDFFHFLFQDDLNGPINPQVHHDMTAPLQHYYIYTGHNSYLTGNQISSDCSEIPIVRALENGVRGIELDLWPNSSKDNVHVLHGRTLTTPVSLIKCLKSIKEHAFVKSPYPVIVTLEDHLTPELQAKVAEMAIQIFGDMLFFPESGYLEEFPSPEALKHRIIFSTKPPKEYLGINTGKDGNWLLNMKDDSADENEADDKSDSDDETSCARGMQQKSSSTTAPQYKRLIAIHARNAKNKSLRQVLKVEPNGAGRLSLSEDELVKAAALYATALVRFTQKNILRIYPKGTRVTSSNFRPTTGWIHGAQMVAFNMQGYGKSLWMMHGMFRSNGGCGYVKRPEVLTEKDLRGDVFNPKLPWPVQTTLKVTVYMGIGWRLDFSHRHFDKHSPPDFYTKVYIFGVPLDEARGKTRVIIDEWVPHWDHVFSFPLRLPQLALLRIEVREYDLSEKDDFGGQACLMVSELRPGIRSVPLYDKKGQKFKSVRLLMRFQFV